MDLTVRRVGIKAADSLALIGSATFLETFADAVDTTSMVAHCVKEHSTSAYRQYLDQPQTAAWLAETATGNGPIGYALLCTGDLPIIKPGDIELKRIYTLSRFHGTHAGVQLLTCALDYAMATGSRRLVLSVYAGNERAIAFYRKHGFNQIEILSFKVNDREYENLAMVKDLW